jgi:hypothetical protein
MLEVIVLSALVAGPDVVVITDHDPAPDTWKTLEGQLRSAPLNASGIYASLFSTEGILPIHDFDQFRTGERVQERLVATRAPGSRHETSQVPFGCSGPIGGV